MTLSLVDEPGTANCGEEGMQVQCHMAGLVELTTLSALKKISTRSRLPDILDYNRGSTEYKLTNELPVLIILVVPRDDSLSLFEFASFWSPHKVAVNRGLQVVAHLHPLLARIAACRV